MKRSLYRNCVVVRINSLNNTLSQVHCTIYAQFICCIRESIGKICKIYAASRLHNFPLSLSLTLYLSLSLILSVLSFPPSLLTCFYSSHCNLISLYSSHFSLPSSLYTSLSYSLSLSLTESSFLS